MPQTTCQHRGKSYKRIIPMDTVQLRYPDKLIYVHLANCLGLSIVDTLHVIAQTQLEALGRPDWLPRPIPPKPRRKPPQRKRSPRSVTKK